LKKMPSRENRSRPRNKRTEDTARKQKVGLVSQRGKQKKKGRGWGDKVGGKELEEKNSRKGPGQGGRGLGEADRGYLQQSLNV